MAELVECAIRLAAVAAMLLGPLVVTAALWLR